MRKYSISVFFAIRLLFCDEVDVGAGLVSSNYEIILELVPAASNTSRVSMPILLKILASSFTKAILISRWDFSITLAASATLMERGARSCQAPSRGYPVSAALPSSLSR